MLLLEVLPRFEAGFSLGWRNSPRLCAGASDLGDVETQEFLTPVLVLHVSVGGTEHWVLVQCTFIYEYAYEDAIGSAPIRPAIARAFGLRDLSLKAKDVDDHGPPGRGLLSGDPKLPQFCTFYPQPLR
ncbi:hypothetical protein KQX54_003350 [Cotesia glomerata]|uniref:Uncharacterized protein n=1 Tax=Cotesia glomerata TaxID=32391 RepID=A0AAV7IMB2_COTGL|nr:hypothetical protein KQX54_003350 [Cotesia glomerata]